MCACVCVSSMRSKRHHNECDGISNHWRFDCLLNCLFRHRSVKISKLRVSGLCQGNPPVTSGFPLQGASNAENVSIWWHHPVLEGILPKGPFHHAYAWQIGPFWQDTLILPLWLLGNSMIHMKLVTSPGLRKWLSQDSIKPSWSLFWNWTFAITHFVLLIWEFL